MLSLTNRFLGISLGMAAAVLSMLAYNYWLDPYRVFSTDFTNRIVEPNQSFLKMEHVLANPDRYDTLMFGSSRVGHIPMQKFYGEKAYNFTYSDGLPREHYRNIKTMIDSGVKLKRVFIGLDESSYLLDPRDHEQQHLRRFHPAVTGEGKLEFYINYLFRYPSIVDELLLLWELGGVAAGGSKAVDYDVKNSGRPLCRSCDVDIDQHVQAHLQDRRFESFVLLDNQYNMEDALQDIVRLRKLADAQNFELVLFFNPLFLKRYLSMDLAELNRYKERLAQVTDYYDFAQINDIVGNKLNFYESIHYRENVGKMILSAFDEKFLADSIAPVDFSTKVNNKNVGQHLDSLKLQLKNYSNSVYDRMMFNESKVRYQRQKIVRYLGTSGYENISSVSDVQCHIDTINDQPIADDSGILPVETHSNVKGWFGGHAGQPVVLLRANNSVDAYEISILYGLARPDVAKVFGVEYENSGFYASIGKPDVEPGVYELALALRDGTNLLICNHKVKVRVQ